MGIAGVIAKITGRMSSTRPVSDPVIGKLGDKKVTEGPTSGPIKNIDTCVKKYYDANKVMLDSVDSKQKLTLVAKAVAKELNLHDDSKLKNVCRAAREALGMEPSTNQINTPSPREMAEKKEKVVPKRPLSSLAKQLREFIKENPHATPKERQDKLNELKPNPNGV